MIRWSNARVLGALFLLCFPPVVRAAEAPLHPVRMDIPSQDDFADLAPLGEAIGDKRIVMLDELTHGEGNIYAYKARVVRYLHERKDFNVLVLESGLFDVVRLWQQRQPVREQAPGKIFYMYANSAEVWPLFDYLDTQRDSANPLALAGLDGRLSGSLSRTQLVPQLHAHLMQQSHTASQVVRLEQHLGQIQRLLDGQLGTANVATQRQFLHDGQWLDSLLPAPDAEHGTDVFDSDGFWRRINASVQRMAEVAWKQRPFDEHDPVMAGNLQWLLEQAYPGRKAVVWGHYAHLNRLGGYRDGHPAGFPLVDNVTRALPAALQAETYVLHFSGAQGRYLDYADQHVIDVVAKPGLLESTLTAASPTGAVFVDLHVGTLPGEFDSTTRLWGMDYTDTLPLSESRKRFDGLLLFKQITPATYLSH